MSKEIGKKLRQLFRRKQVLNLGQIMEVVDERSTRTVFRCLEELDYISSYTHTRSYYTLREIAAFNQEGFWHYGEIGFSVHGSLKDILVHLINSSDAGRTHSELEQLQKCRAHNALRELVKDERLQRKNIDGVYVYTAVDPEKAKAQLTHRGQFSRAPSDHTIIDILLAAVMVLQTMGELTIASVIQKLGERKSTITESEVAWTFHKYGLEKKNAGLYAVEAFYRIVNRYTVHLNEKSLFALPPSILLESSHSECPSCKGRLLSLKSKTRTIVTMATGPIIIREKIAICRICGADYRATCLEERVSPGCKFGFDVIAHVGEQMFLKYKADREIVASLKKKNISISRSQVAELGKQFVGYLALLHKKNLHKIRELLFFWGTWILHLDGTNSGAGAHLIAAMDGIKEIVLGSIKTHSENTLELIPFLENLKKAYGSPLAAVHDISPAIIAAVEAVFPDSIDLICHFHFLRDIGKDLLDYEYTRIKEILKTYKTECSLKKMVKEMREMIKIYKAEAELEAYLQKRQKGQPSQLTCPLLIAYTVGSWILDYENESNGYGYPFDKILFVFCERLKAAQTHLQGLSEKIQLNGHIVKLQSCISAVLGDEGYCRHLPHLRMKIGYFERLREALGIAPLDGKNGLNDNGGDVDIQRIKNQVQTFFDSKDVQMAANTDDSIQKMLQQITKYWSKLFADPIVVVTKTGEKVLVYPQRTNNILEQLFRYLLRVHCKRAGYSKMSRYLQAVIADTPMIKNLLNPEYMETLLGGKTLAECFAEIDKDLVMEAVMKDKLQEAGMTPSMRKVLRQLDFSIEVLAG